MDEFYFSYNYYYKILLIFAPGGFLHQICWDQSDANIRTYILINLPLLSSPDVAVAAVGGAQERERLQEGGVMVLREAQHVNDHFAAVARDGVLQLLLGVQQLMAEVDQ